MPIIAELPTGGLVLVTVEVDLHVDALVAPVEFAAKLSSEGR